MKIRNRAICEKCARFHSELISFANGPYLCPSCHNPPPYFLTSVFVVVVLAILAIMYVVIFGG